MNDIKWDGNESRDPVEDVKAAMHYLDDPEGIVVRNSSEFYFDQFKYNVAKYVRTDHVQTDQHWSQQKIIRNEVQ